MAGSGVGGASGVCANGSGDGGFEGCCWWWARWSKYPGAEDGDGRGSARWLRAQSSRLDAEDGVVVEGAPELALLVIDSGEKASSCRLRGAGPGKAAALLRGPIGCAAIGCGWCLKYDDCCWMCGPWGGGCILEKKWLSASGAGAAAAWASWDWCWPVRAATPSRRPPKSGARLLDLDGGESGAAAAAAAAAAAIGGSPRGGGAACAEADGGEDEDGVPARSPRFPINGADGTIAELVIVAVVVVVVVAAVAALGALSSLGLLMFTSDCSSVTSIDLF